MVINNFENITENICISNSNCLDSMKNIPDASIDFILADLPYGILNKSNQGAKWDNVLPFDQLWEEYKRVIKENGAIVLFSQGIFTVKLISSNERDWKYNWIWKKGNRSTGMLNAKKQPLRNHEDICVFYKKQPTYNPQMTQGKPNHSNKSKNELKNNVYGKFIKVEPKLDGLKYPTSILDFDRDYKNFYHPTQKPVALLEYLIKTYTNENDIVLDNTMGSGSTMVACKHTNRQGIGIEIENKYYDIAKKRILEE